MLKKYLFLALLGAVCLLNGKEIAIENLDFSAGLKNWRGVGKQSEFQVIPLDGINTLVVRGSEQGESQVSGYRQIILPIPVSTKDIRGQKVTLSAEIKVERLSGSFKLMIRESRKKSTLHYRQTIISKWENTGEWNRYNCECYVSKKTERLQIYLQSCFLKPGDKLYVRNLKLDISPIVKR